VAAREQARESCSVVCFDSLHYQELITKLRARGVPPQRISVWHWGADGVEMKTFAVHNTQVFVITSPELDAAHVSKKFNCKTAMVIPGPKVPPSLSGYLVLLLSLFEVKGSDGAYHCTLAA